VKLVEEAGPLPSVLATSRPVKDTDGRKRKNWRGPRHRMRGTGARPGFLACRYCGMEHTIGSQIGERTGYWYKFPGEQKWTRYNIPGHPIPVCPNGTPKEVPPKSEKPKIVVRFMERKFDLRKIATRLGLEACMNYDIAREYTNQQVRQAKATVHLEKAAIYWRARQEIHKTIRALRELGRGL
jgi:hypothetical protein